MAVSLPCRVLVAVKTKAALLLSRLVSSKSDFTAQLARALNLSDIVLLQKLVDIAVCGSC